MKVLRLRMKMSHDCEFEWARIQEFKAPYNVGCSRLRFKSPPNSSMQQTLHDISDM